MTIQNPILGYIDCPHCNKEIPLKESKKGKCYYNCDNCGQFFARTKSIDEALRKKARPARKENSENGKREGRENEGGLTVF